MTNVIAFLHTTAAYQAAALQLMTAEANFVAEQLQLPERLPQQTNQLHIAEVDPPLLGVTGTVGSTNYAFSFERGYLSSVKKLDWAKRPPLADVRELATLRSQIDTNGAYHLATQSLASIGVDVTKLSERFPSYAVQMTRPSRAPANNSAPTARLTLPIFMVGWGERPPPSDVGNPVRMRLLGTIPELVELQIRDRSFFRRPRLVVRDAAELLGPMPPPQRFVEGLFGGPAGYRTVSEADQIELFVLNSRHREEEATLPEVRAGPVKVNGRQRKQLSDILLAFETYQWGVVKMCSPDYGIKARFVLGLSVVEVLFCFECDILQVTFSGQSRHENFDFNHNALAKIVQEAFPRDAKVLQIEDDPDEGQDRENFLRDLARQTQD